MISSFFRRISFLCTPSVSTRIVFFFVEIWSAPFNSTGTATCVFSSTTAKNSTIALIFSFRELIRWIVRSSISHFRQTLSPLRTSSRCNVSSIGSFPSRLETVRPGLSATYKSRKTSCPWITAFPSLTCTWSISTSPFFWIICPISAL